MKPHVTVLASALFLLGPHLARAATGDCESLTALALPHASVTLARTQAQYPLEAEADPSGPPPVKTPFCRVAVTSRPTADSEILIELWIPLGAAWNGRYLQVGNGGFAGRMPFRSMMAGLKKGYAVAGTDDGHEAVSNDDSTDASWAAGHPQKVVDFGYRALKETTDLSKTILTVYAAAPKFSYFNGCSDGGREALMEAQRFPMDFDGIVAGDPANDWTHLQAAGALGQQALFRSKMSYVPISKLPALQAAARRVCADADGVIDNPLTCRFDPTVIECRGPETDACLTHAQLATVKTFYAGTRGGDGRLIMPGLEPGAEAEKNGWGPWVIGEAPTGGKPSLAYKFNENFFSDVVHPGEHYDLMSFRYDRDMPAIEAKFAPLLNSTDPDLSAFKGRGGKLIQYHGWADPAIPSKASIVYFEAVQQRMGDTAAFYRLFMVPGMLHCAGGPGPSAFDTQAAISAWVEEQKPPSRIVAVKFVADDPRQGVARDRPLCPYPQTASWNGAGDRSKAANYICSKP